MFLCLNCNIIKRHNIWRNIHHFRSRQVGWLFWGLTSIKRSFSHISTWKQEITNLWKFKWRGRKSNPGPLAPLGHRCSSDPDRQYGLTYLYFPRRNGKTWINRNNFGMGTEWNWNICLSAFSQTADLTCNHIHCIWRVYSSAFPTGINDNELVGFVPKLIILYFVDIVSLRSFL